jgi:hypothetical protein
MSRRTRNHRKVDTKSIAGWILGGVGLVLMATFAAITSI